MSYFKALKLTKKGEQLQAKVNGNLSETLVFTRAKLGAGTITSEDEIRFLTDIKEMWGTANVSSCKIEGEDKNRVALELQFSNAELVEDKIFREIGLFARGNDNEEILYAYANAADKYDYIPLMKDSPHSFIIVIYFIIASGTKIEANIDLNSYVSLKKFNEEMAKKANKTDRASTEEYGLTKYGTEEGTSLEGNKFTQMTGKDYGGILNIAGQKEAGKAYWDNNTKKLYICKNNNSDISPNVNNYVPFDSNSLLERLENLSKYDFVDKTQGTRYTSLIFRKKGNVCHVFLDIPSTISNSLVDGSLIFTFPKEFKPKTFNLKLIISNPSGRTARTRYDANTGNLYVLTKLDVAESMYLDTFYFID
jgi:hypothetical protein